MATENKILISGSNPMCRIWAEKLSGLGEFEIFDGSFNSQSYTYVFDLNYSRSDKQKFLSYFTADKIQTDVLISSLISVTASAVSEMTGHHYPVLGTCLYRGVEENTHLELTRALNTNQEILSEFSKKLSELGFTTYEVKDSVALVSLRTVACIINEAVSVLHEQVAVETDIDTSMQLGTNYPLGPLRWADKIGLDVVLTVLDSLYGEYHDDRYRSSVLLRQMVRSHHLGVSTNRGFFSY